ncbi:MAG: methyltransferase domain-containing protein [Clostridiales bacterium]|nr:methyltransferase domain-containing protein [Clostridiales bacterium]MCF8023588.1 methyltransferase domain-containing protein [Clostridiales bacterium]
MEYTKSKKYDKKFIMNNMMGPNSIKMLEELLWDIQLKPDMRVIDLGCGKGLTSIFLAKEFGVQVFATDLWITATENYNRFQSLNLENQIIPIYANALEMPYANGFFDAVISVDSYHYFGRDDQYMDAGLALLLKKDGIIVLAIPGLKEDIHDSVPEEMTLYWDAEDIDTWHSCQWWRELLGKSQEIEIESIKEMQGFEECWSDWLLCENEYAISDRAAMEAGAGKYMNLIFILASRK